MFARRMPLHAAVALLAAPLLVFVSSASAAQAYWSLESRAEPTNLPLKGEGQAVGTTIKPKAPTPAQKLAKALKTCRQKAGSTRRSCEAAAKTRYGPRSKARKTKKPARSTGRGK